MTAAAYPTSYRDLLTSFDGTGRYRPLDALVVPASRSAEHLRSAAALAHKTDAELLVLCSRNAEPAAVARLMAEEHVARHHVVHMRPDYDCRLLPSAPAPTNLVEFASRPELSRKRNLGLLVARMVGWRTVLFLDDDITLGVADLRVGPARPGGRGGRGLPGRRLAGQLRRRPRQPGERRRAGRVRGAVRPAGRHGVGAARLFPGDLRRGCALPLRHHGGTPG